MTTDPLAIYETFREDQRAEANAVRQHGLRMELHYSSDAPRWFVMAGDMVLGQYSHRSLVALHLITERYA
jgi:hypothetical protein